MMKPWEMHEKWVLERLAIVRSGVPDRDAGIQDYVVDAAIAILWTAPREEHGDYLRGIVIELLFNAWPRPRWLEAPEAVRAAVSFLDKSTAEDNAVMKSNWSEAACNALLHYRVDASD